MYYFLNFEIYWLIYHNLVYNSFSWCKLWIDISEFFDINIYITTPQQFTLLHITIDAVKIVVASGKKGKSTHNAPV